MVDSCSLSLVSAQKQFFFLFILYFGDSKKQYHCNAEKGNRKNCVKKLLAKRDTLLTETSAFQKLLL